MTVEVLRASVLAVPHGFFGIAGGIGDRAVGVAAPGRRLLRVRQTHSALCHVAGDWSEGAWPEGDALVTDRAGIALGIVTADCAPVLLADAKAGVIGAAHAGWRGAFGGILQNTVAAMERLGADRSNIAAAIGPCIAQKSYEVDDTFRSPFIDENRANERFFLAGTRAAHHQFDLEAFVVGRLGAAGLTEIEALGQDTYCQPSRFHSFRRTTHDGVADCGRQIALIALA